MTCCHTWMSDKFLSEPNGLAPLKHYAWLFAAVQVTARSLAHSCVEEVGCWRVSCDRSGKACSEWRSETGGRGYLTWQNLESSKNKNLFPLKATIRQGKIQISNLFWESDVTPELIILYPWFSKLSRKDFHKFVACLAFNLSLPPNPDWKWLTLSSFYDPPLSETLFHSKVELSEPEQHGNAE